MLPSIFALLWAIARLLSALTGEILVENKFQVNITASLITIPNIQNKPISKNVTMSPNLIPNPLIPPNGFLKAFFVFSNITIPNAIGSKTKFTQKNIITENAPKNAYSNTKITKFNFFDFFAIRMGFKTSIMELRGTNADTMLEYFLLYPYRCRNKIISLRYIAFFCSVRNA
jgi:hypothetical protein